MCFRAHVAETGSVAALGRSGVAELLGVVEADDDRLLSLERETLSHLVGQIRDAAPGSGRRRNASSPGIAAVVPPDASKPFQG